MFWTRIAFGVRCVFRTPMTLDLLHRLLSSASALVWAIVCFGTQSYLPFSAVCFLHRRFSLEAIKSLVPIVLDFLYIVLWISRHFYISCRKSSRIGAHTYSAISQSKSNWGPKHATQLKSRAHYWQLKSKTQRKWAQPKVIGSKTHISTRLW